MKIINTSKIIDISMFFFFLATYLAYVIFIRFYTFQSISGLQDFYFVFNSFISLFISLGFFLIYNLCSENIFFQHLKSVGFDKVYYLSVYLISFHFITNINIYGNDGFIEYVRVLVNSPNQYGELTFLFAAISYLAIIFLCLFGFFYFIAILYFTFSYFSDETKSTRNFNYFYSGYFIMNNDDEGNFVKL